MREGRSKEKSRESEVETSEMQKGRGRKKAAMRKILKEGEEKKGPYETISKDRERKIGHQSLILGIQDAKSIDTEKEKGGTTGYQTKKKRV